MKWNYLRRKRPVLAAICAMLCFAILYNIAAVMAQAREAVSSSAITWVDFDVTAQAMEDALNYDVNSQEQEHQIDWVDLLAYLGAKYGGNFSSYKLSDMKAVAERLSAGESIEDLTDGMKYFEYYRAAYGAVLDGLVGEYSIQAEESPGGAVVYEQKYGLKAYSPIAYGYTFSHSDDFGNSRSYGYKRIHLGHDLMGNVGTPIINVETCVVEVLGWNQYGGWRIGMRSLDGRRYYYYAHLQKGHPYAEGLETGQLVYAGDVIGYMGMTGYSSQEDYNGMSVPHLHFGLQLIFDEELKEQNEIWIDCYELVKFLEHHKSPVVSTGNGDFVRKYMYSEGVE